MELCAGGSVVWLGIKGSFSCLYGVRLCGNQFRDADQVVGDEVQQESSKSSSRREPDVPAELLRALFGNVTKPTGGEPSITIDVSRATPMSATKRRALGRTAWSCIRTATTTRSSFTTCMNFIRTISEGSRDAESGKSRRKRQRALRAREDAERPLLHVLAAVDRDIGAGHERRLVRA
jgi:hypothetical protein